MVSEALEALGRRPMVIPGRANRLFGLLLHRPTILLVPFFQAVVNDQLDQPVGELSGGEQARVHIARLMLLPAPQQGS